MKRRYASVWLFSLLNHGNAFEFLWDLSLKADLILICELLFYMDYQLLMHYHRQPGSSLVNGVRRSSAET